MIGLYPAPYVRVTHKPTGIYAQCSSERSQHRNRVKAIELLRARMYVAKHVERTEALVRAYDLPDGVECLPDEILNDIGVSP